MDSERKAILFDHMLGYLVALISDEQEIQSVLINLGFTKEEILTELDWLNV